MSVMDDKAIIKNIQEGNILFGQYIDLREALVTYSKDKDIYSLYKSFFAILKGKDYKIDFKENATIEFINSAIKELYIWQQREEKTLQGTTTAQEEQAGIKEFSQQVGWLGIVIPLCKDFAISPDTLLDTWKYKEVYSVLFYENQKAKYEQRLTKIFKTKK